MTVQLTIHFDSEKTRKDFFEDIGECIFWNDNQRDIDSQCNYEVSTTYELPGVDRSDSSESGGKGLRLSYKEASHFLAPAHPVYAMLSR
jgi:hypothetical protein